MLPPQLTEICDAFIQNQPFLTTPDGALGTCEWVAKEFCRLYPETRATPVYLSGYRNAKPNRHSYWRNYANPDPYFFHAMIMFPDGTVIDFSHKQIDHDGPVYQIYSRQELEADWLVMSTDADMLEGASDTGSALCQHARYIENGGGWPDHIPIWRQAWASMAADTAAVVLQETLCHISTGRITVTGTQDDNYVLRGLHEEWPQALAKIQTERELVVHRVKDCCDRFMSTHPRFFGKSRQEIADAVATRCVYVTEDFLDLFPELGGMLLALYGYRTPHPNKHEEFAGLQDPNPDFYHVVALFPHGVIVDLTCLQLDDEGPLYQLTSFGEIQKEWLMLAPCNETTAFSAFLVDIPRCLGWTNLELQATVGDFSWTTYIKPCFHTEEFEKARKFYLATKELLFQRSLVMTWPEETNPHSKTWVRYHALFEPKATPKEPLVAVSS
jgi:hypothetical protein